MNIFRHFTAIVTLSVLPAAAEIIGVDQFDYPDGPIAGRDGGTFWNYKNTAPTGHSGAASSWGAVIASPQVTAGHLETSGNAAAKREYRRNTESEGAVNDVNVAKKVFYRVNVTTGPSVTAADYFGISSLDFGTEKLYFGKRGGSTTFGVEEVGGAGTNGGVTIQPNTTYVLVAVIDYANDFIRLFVNPNLNGAEPNSAVAAATRTYTGTNWSTAVRFAAGTAVLWDDLVVATEWADLNPVVVTTMTDEDNGILGGGTGLSLREAVNYAATGRTITFASNLSGATMTLTDPLFIARALTIDASAVPEGITLSGNDTHRHFFVDSGKSLNLRNLTLTRGRGLFFENGGSGGAILNFGSLTLSQCTLSGNSTDIQGGAISNSGNLMLTQCTLSGNSTSIQGGAISNSGNLILTQCTLSGNSASEGGGIHSASGNLTLSNTIVAGNIAPNRSDIFLLSGPIIPTGVNLIGDLAGSTLTAGSTLLTGDPKLSPLGKYGGTMQTMPPLAGSPAIDAAGATSFFTKDQRGLNRVVDGNNSGAAQTDIGAVESAFRFVDVGSDHATSPAAGSLRKALIDAATTPGWEAIAFTPGFNGSTFTLVSELRINDLSSVTIDATNQPVGITLNGNNSTRLIRVVNGTSLTLFGLNLTGGNGASGILPTLGGAILNDGGALTLAQCSLFGNSTSFVGGAIYNNTGGTLALTQCTLSGNSSRFGGAISSDSTLSLTQCTLSGNSASEFGGAINSNATLILSNNIVAGNTAPAGPDILRGDFTGSTISRIGMNLIGDLAGSALTVSPTLITGDPKLSPLGNYRGPTQTMPPLPGSPTIDAAVAVNEVQLISVITLPTVFTLTFNGATTGSLNQFLNASDVATALQNLNTIGSGNISVIKTNNETNQTFFEITFLGPRGGLDQPLLISNNAGAAITTVQNGSPGSLFISDQRGFSRRRDGDRNGTALPDLGAVESSVRYVTVASDSMASPATGSLRHALTEAATTPGWEAIAFDPDLSGQTISLAGQINITDEDGVTIDASTLPGGLTLNGNNTNRHFRLTTAKVLALRGLTLTGGNSNGDFGGAIENREGSLTLTQCTLSGNSAGSGNGGAIFNFGSTSLTLTQCTLSGNSALVGGAIFNTGSGPLTLTQCTLSGNSAVSSGGGIFNTSSGTLRLNNTIAAGNTGNEPDINQMGSSIIPTGVNLIGNLTGSGLSSGSTVLVGNANLAPLGNYGGPTHTMALRPGSPARNAATGSTHTTDQRGFSMVGLPDIGAYEAGNAMSTNYNAFIWETLPNTATALQTATTFDFDSDGMSNESEFNSGTAAENPASLFRITSFVPSGASFLITFPSVPGKTYTLWQNDTLTDTWTNTGLPALFGNGTAQTFTVSVPVPPSTRRFYRVHVNP